jgi:hypothetical protein
MKPAKMSSVSRLVAPCSAMISGRNSNTLWRSSTAIEHTRDTSVEACWFTWELKSVNLLPAAQKPRVQAFADWLGMLHREAVPGKQKMMSRQALDRQIQTFLLIPWLCVRFTFSHSLDSST